MNLLALKIHNILFKNDVHIIVLNIIHYNLTICIYLLISSILKYSFGDKMFFHDFMCFIYQTTLY